MTLVVTQAVQTQVQALVPPALPARAHRARRAQALQLHQPQVDRAVQQVHPAAVHPQTDLWIRVFLTRCLLHTLIEWAHCQIWLRNFA